MTPDKLRNLVTTAVSLDRQIADLTDQLKRMKEQIALEAESCAEDATATEGGGLSLTFEGNDGCIARVTTSAATLKSTIKGDDKKFPKIKDAACGCFGRLFETELVYKLVPEFREQALGMLAAKDAAKLIKLCESPGRTSVAFETKEA